MITRRCRVGVSTSVKGIKSFDCTVEITSDDLSPNDLREMQLSESDALVKELDKRYPPPQE